MELVPSIFGVIFILAINELCAQEYLWCMKEIPKDESDTLPKLTTIDPFRPPIFFMETTCTSRNAGRVILNPRQACGVESAARMNPGSDIFVLIPTIAKLEHRNDTIDDRVTSELLKYPNVHFRYVNFMEIIGASPLVNITETLLHSQFAIWHTSHILRLLVLFKYGGTYLDFDVVVKKPLKPLKVNYVAPQSDTVFCNAVLNFDSNGIGNELVSDWITYLKDNYNPNVYSINGGAVLTNLLKKLCGVDTIAEMSTDRCGGIQILPRRYFYPIYYSKWKIYMTTEDFVDGLRATENSHLIHVWNYFSRAMSVNVHDLTVYKFWAGQYCPNVLSLIEDIF